MTTVRLADYLISQLPRLGVDRVFAVTGGGAMHLDDAVRSCPGVDVMFNQHEQACAIAVEGYARAKGTLGVAVVTSGPGGTNCITGVLGMWHDSIPGLFLSGQVRFDTTVASTGLPLRQLGDQEGDIVRMVAPITKYAAMIRDPLMARYQFEKAVYLARAGRPGPVWLDVPLNVQSAQVDPELLRGFDPRELDDLPDQQVTRSADGPSASWRARWRLAKACRRVRSGCRRARRRRIGAPSPASSTTASRPTRPSSSSRSCARRSGRSSWPARRSVVPARSTTSGP